jgi:hypothetical protein
MVCLQPIEGRRPRPPPLSSSHALAWLHAWNVHLGLRDVVQKISEDRRRDVPDDLHHRFVVEASCSQSRQIGISKVAARVEHSRGRPIAMWLRSPPAYASAKKPMIRIVEIAYMRRPALRIFIQPALTFTSYQLNPVNYFAFRSILVFVKKF